MSPQFRVLQPDSHGWSEVYVGVVRLGALRLVDDPMVESIIDGAQRPVQMAEPAEGLRAALNWLLERRLAPSRR